MVAFQDFCAGDVQIVARVDIHGRQCGVVIYAKLWTQTTEITLTNRNEKKQINIYVHCRDPCSYTYHCTMYISPTTCEKGNIVGMLRDKFGEIKGCTHLYCW
jgi:hypothetical protein